MSLIRKINFNAGPAALPPEVLEQASAAMLSYKDTGMSVLELPHRGKAFLEIIEESKALVRELCGLDSTYEVLWMQGGGRMQFAMIPMNLLAGGRSAGYIDSGHWSAEAMAYAKYYGTVQELASSKAGNYCRLPQVPVTQPAGLAYVHYTTNNTIYGTQWHTAPHTDAPLVADMSSDVLSRQMDYTRFGMFYAAAQKNLGTPGVGLAVIHKDLLQDMATSLPPMLSYQAQVKENSILNTANVSGTYISLLMLRWIKERGMAAIEQENRAKAGLLYTAIDASALFRAHVQEKSHRSLMNVCFTAKDQAAADAFLKMAREANITGIEGHRLVGGFRVSLYNAIPLSWTTQLVQLMQEFERKY